MTNVRADTVRPPGTTTLVLHCGSPAADQVFNLPGIAMVRVWDDDSLAAFTASGEMYMYVRESSYWAFIWQ